MRETHALPLVAGEEELLSTRATSAEPEDGAVLVAESVDDCHSAIHNREPSAANAAASLSAHFPQSDDS